MNTRTQKNRLLLKVIWHVSVLFTALTPLLSGVASGGSGKPCTSAAAAIKELQELADEFPLSWRKAIFSALDPWMKTAPDYMRAATESTVLQWLFAQKQIKVIIKTRYWKRGRAKSWSLTELTELVRKLRMRRFGEKFDVEEVEIFKNVFEWKTPNELLWFPLTRESVHTFRKTLAAQLLSKALGINEAAHPLFLVENRNMFGFAALRTLGFPEKPNYPFEKLKLSTQVDATAFSFLIGGALTDPATVQIRPGHPPEIQIIHFQNAFSETFPDSRASIAPEYLPVTYTTQFREGILGLREHPDWDIILSLLSERERLAFLFRRDLILTDMRFRCPLPYINDYKDLFP